MDKKGLASEYFQEELSRFEGKGLGILEFTKAVMDSLPAAFYGGPEDPGYTAIHTKMCFAFGEVRINLAHMKEHMQPSDRDIVRAALLLHDGLAYGPDGKSKKIIYTHPMDMATLIRDVKWDNLLPAFFRDEIAQVVETHSGEWGHDPQKKGKSMPMPKTEKQILVHECITYASKMETTLELEGLKVKMETSRKKTRSKPCGV